MHSVQKYAILQMVGCRSAAVLPVQQIGRTVAMASLRWNTQFRQVLIPNPYSFAPLGRRILREAVLVTERLADL